MASMGSPGTTPDRRCSLAHVACWHCCCCGQPNMRPQAGPSVCSVASGWHARHAELEAKATTRLLAGQTPLQGTAQGSRAIKLACLVGPPTPLVKTQVIKRRPQSVCRRSGDWNHVCAVHASGASLHPCRISVRSHALLALAVHSSHMALWLPRQSSERSFALRSSNYRRRGDNYSRPSTCRQLQQRQEHHPTYLSTPLEANALVSSACTYLHGTHRST